MFFFSFQTERKEQHFTPGKFTCMKLPDDKLLLQDECNQTSLYEMSRNRLRVIEKLGEGNFGMVSAVSARRARLLAAALDPRRRTPANPDEGGGRNVIGMRDDILINNCQFHV